MDMPLGEYLAEHVPDQQAEPPWEGMSPREQAQWLMNEAADVSVLEEKDPYVLRAIACLLMSIDDRLGRVQWDQHVAAKAADEPIECTCIYPETSSAHEAGCAMADDEHEGPPRGPGSTRVAAMEDWADHLATLPRGWRSSGPCSAHGVERCTWCAQTAPGGLDERGGCRGCESYSETGLHRAGCAHRIRTAPPVPAAEVDELTAEQVPDPPHERPAGPWVVGDRVRTPAGNTGVITRIAVGHAGTFADLRTDAGHQMHIKIESLLPATAPEPLSDTAIRRHNAAVALRLAAEAMEQVVRTSALAVPDAQLLTERAAVCRRALLTNSPE